MSRYPSKWKAEKLVEEERRKESFCNVCKFEHSYPNIACGKCGTCASLVYPCWGKTKVAP